MTAERRTRWRLALRDLSAGAAFASMAISGQIPLWAVGLFAVALAVALRGLRPFAGHETLTAILLLASGIALFGSVPVRRLDLVVAACTFAGLITSHRVLSHPARGTDNQVLLTSIMMIAGGAALSGELSFAPCLVAFAAFASFCVGLNVLDATAEPGEDVPLKPMVLRITGGLAFAVMGAAVFFTLCPRVSWNVSGRRVSPGLASPTAGFADSVRLGGTGSIKTNPRIILRATLTPDPGVESLNAYWVGRTYEQFRGDEWTNAPRTRPALPQVTFRPGARNLIHQRIELLPAFDAHTVIALAPPALVGNAVGHVASGNIRTDILELGGEELRFEEKALSYTYHAYSLPPDAPVPPVRGEDADRYLELPTKLDPRVRALATRIAGNEQDPLTVAHKVEAYLRRTYAYSLELSGDVDDPLADFLFVRKQGHCEHFATALTVLLRVLKIPARVASGFYGGERISGNYVLRAGDAHAWTQALIPGVGFVTLDATPEAHRGGQPSELFDWLTRGYEWLESFWIRGVVDYSFNDQAAFARLLAESRAPSPSRDFPLTRILEAVAVSALIIVAARRWRRVRGTASSTHPATALLETLERTLARSGLSERAREPLEEVSERMARSAHPASVDVQRATRRYLEARFGGKPLRPGERQHLMRRVQRALIRPPGPQP